MSARREVVSAVLERYRSAKRAEKGSILDALCATTGWHRKHAVRALRQHETVGPGEVEALRERRRRYGATIKDALTALWEASDRVCGKRLKGTHPVKAADLSHCGRRSDEDQAAAFCWRWRSQFQGRSSSRRLAGWSCKRARTSASQA